MKFNLSKTFLFFLLITSFCINPFSVEAVIAVKEKSSVEKIDQRTKNFKSSAKQLKIKQKKERKKLQLKAKMKKILQKFKRKRSEKGPVIDFEDPVQKWLWFSIFLFGAALALGIVLRILSLGGILGFVAGFLALGSVVCLVIWLVKYLA